jgi:protein-disulfide isomerase
MNASATLTPPVSSSDHASGPADAPVTLTEFGDYQCPYCGETYPVIKRLQKVFGQKLRFVFRNFPLTQSHPFAMVAAEVAEAAALQGKFWEMHDLLYGNQERLAADVLLPWAKELGLDIDKLGTALREGEVAKRIKADRRSGISSGVNGTPSLFINGLRYDGPRDFDTLRAVLAEVMSGVGT